MLNTLLILSSVVLIAACTPPKPATPATSVVRYSAEAEFENVRDDLQNAIIAKGLVIDNTSHIAKMLERTGKDVGSTKPVFAEDRGQAFSFCSATTSRKTMEADAHNIAFCPYSLAVYSTVTEPKKVYVAYRRPVLTEGSETAKASLKEVETLLDGIAREALHLKDLAK
jgi:uncharacterized protein (DUF302 family)